MEDEGGEKLSPSSDGEVMLCGVCGRPVGAEMLDDEAARYSGRCFYCLAEEQSRGCCDRPEGDDDG